MQCPQCGKTGFVTIGGKRFCSNCGAKLDKAAAGPMKTMADVKPSRKTLDLRSAGSTQTKSATAVMAAAGNARPAGQFHGKQVSGAAVLDLRAKPSPPASPSPSAVAAVPAAPQPDPVVVPPAPQPQPTPPLAAPTPSPRPTVVPKKSAVITPASTVTVPETAAVPAASKSKSHTSESPSPLLHRFPANPLVAKTDPNAMPAAVGAHLDAMKTRAATASPPPVQPQSPALRQALIAAKQSTATPSVLKIGAALLAITIMGGIVWLQNSPKLAFRNDAAQAGIDASLPTYIPSSYHQNGAVAVSPGQLTLNFASPSSSQPLRIIQRSSGWDTNALRENYIDQQTASYVAAQGQGLTIYLYGDQADWINHGVWYQLSGTSNLARDDILKIAYGL